MADSGVYKGTPRGAAEVGQAIGKLGSVDIWSRRTRPTLLGSVDIWSRPVCIRLSTDAAGGSWRMGKPQATGHEPHAPSSTEIPELQRTSQQSLVHHQLQIDG